MPPVKPMLAKSVPTIPTGELSYEPKWDGFRSIVFRDGDEVEIGSRNEKPMTRYFPEVVAGVLEHLPERCVLDGEIIVAVGDRLEFEVLSQRIHPAVSRITKLAQETPARFVAFDLLARGDEILLDLPYLERLRPHRRPGTRRAWRFGWAHHLHHLEPRALLVRLAQRRELQRSLPLALDQSR